MAHTTDAVGASRTTPSVLTKITSSAPRRSASRMRGHVHRVRQRLHATEQPGRLRECGSGEAAVQRDHSQPIPALLPDRLGEGAHRKQPGGYAVGWAARQDEFQSVLTRRSARVECGIDEGAPGRLIERDVERGRGSPHPGEVGRQLVDRTAASGIGLDPAALEAPVSAVDAAVVRPHYRTIRIDESFPKNAQDENGHRAQGRGELVSCADIGPRLRLT